MNKCLYPDDITSCHCVLKNVRYIVILMNPEMQRSVINKKKVVSSPEASRVRSLTTKRLRMKHLSCFPRGVEEAEEAEVR